MKLKTTRVAVPKDAVTPPQLAKQLGCDPSTIRAWILLPTDALPATKIRKLKRTHYYLSLTLAIPWLQRQGVIA